MVRTQRSWARFGAALVGAATLFSALTSAPIARANDREALAQELFDVAMALMDKKNYADACPKLEESFKIGAQLGTLFHLADCQQNLGKLASAWAAFTEVAERARNLRKTEHATEAQARADALKSRLIRLIIVVPDELKTTPGLQIARNGAPIGAAQFGVPLPVDPMKHVIRVSAAGKRTWETSVEATGESNTVTVSIPVLKEEPAIHVSLGSGGETGNEAKWRTTHTLAVAAGGLGVVGLGLGAGFGADALGKASSAKPYCNADMTLCSAEGVRLHSEARTSATVSNAAFIAGAVSAVGATVLWITAPSLSATNKPQPAGVSVGVTGTGVVVSGRW